MTELAERLGYSVLFEVNCKHLLHEKWLSALETGTSMFPGVDELIGERRDGAGRDAHERVGGT